MEGSEGRSLMRLKRELDRVRHNFTDGEYSTLLDLIAIGDTAIVSAFALYQRMKKHE
jgi:hypothetical protein